jgi:hypothetical protein
MAVRMRNIDMRLEDTLPIGSGGYKPPLLLSPQYGYVPQGLTLSPLEVRENVAKRPSSNGTFDYTGLYGNRAVTVPVGIASELVGGDVYDQDLEDTLAAWTHPSVRAYLYWKRPNMRNERRILVRGASGGMPMQFVREQFDIITMQFKAPRGVSEDTVITDSGPIGAGGSLEFGRAYDLTFDRTYPDSLPIGSGLVNNRGNTPVLPLVSIYGPCTQPMLTNMTTGQTLDFIASFSLNANEYLLIDMENGTVWLNGDPTQSRYDKVDFTTTTWWAVQKGVNSLRFHPATQSPPANAQLTFYAQYI